MFQKYPHPDIFTFLVQSTVLYMTSHASLCLPFSFLAQQRSLTKNYRTEKFVKKKPFCSNLPFCRSSVVYAFFQSKKHLAYGTGGPSCQNLLNSTLLWIGYQSVVELPSNTVCWYPSKHLDYRKRHNERKSLDPGKVYPTHFMKLLGINK